MAEEAKTDQASDEVDEATGDAGGQGDAAANGGGDGLLSQVLRKEILIPLGASAASAGIAYLVSKIGKGGGEGGGGGGGLSGAVSKVKEKGNEAGDAVASKAADKGADAAKEKLGGSGGPMGMASGALSKLTGGGDEEDDDDGGEAPEGRANPNTRRLPIQRWTDVAAPLETVYECWTKFDEYPEFMHRVLSVEHDDDENRVKWNEKIWFSKRQWEAEITEMVENDRISWKTISGTKHQGVVSFHRLADNLTRVLVTVDFHPTGLFEKMASGLRFVKRAVQSDLARFKAYVELEVQKGEGGAGDGGSDEAEQDSPQGEQGEQQSDGAPEGPQAAQDDAEQDSGDRDAGDEGEDEDGSTPRAESDGEDDESGEAERREREARREQRRERAAV